MSFALTKEQILNQTKTVTRRNGWKHIKVGDLIQPVEKCMGLKKGEKQVKLGCPIRVVDVRREPLNEITEQEVVMEGFPHWYPDRFMELYMKANGGDNGQEVTRIEFEYTEPLLNNSHGD